MTRLMFDSTTPWDIPRDAKMVAYYVDGRYAWPQAWLDLFPNAIKVSISAIGARVAQVGDVEVGCIWPPANAVPWVRSARRVGIDPTIYVNELNDWGSVRAAFRAAGEPEPHYWVARYNGVREVPAGSVGRQFAHPHDGDGVADRPWETGKHYDLSVMADFWPGVDTENDMFEQQDRTNLNDITKTPGQRERIEWLTEMDTLVRETAAAVKQLKTSGVPVDYKLSAQDKQDIADLVLDGFAKRQAE